MKAQIISLAILVSVLLALGCASDNPQAQDNSTANVSSPAQTMPNGVQNDNGGDASSGAAAPTVANDAMPVGSAPAASACTVDFQRGMGETYYVMVKTNASGEIAVSCPDGTPASRTGNAFFCEKLALPSPVVAYLDGAECGSASFARDEPRQGGAKAICTLSIAPGKIVAGGSTAVSVYASTGGATADLSYDCGDGADNATVTGIYSDTQICYYQTAGITTIWARLNGVPCAGANLTVYATKRGCSVQEGLMNYSVENGQNVYRGIAYGHGYGTNEVLHYYCFGEDYAVRIGNIASSADFAYTVECRSKNSTLAEPVRVLISKEECGSMNP